MNRPSIDKPWGVFCLAPIVFAALGAVACDAAKTGRTHGTAGALASLAPYTPGGSIDFGAYDALVRKVDPTQRGTIDAVAYRGLTEAIEPEMLDAVYEVFSHPNDAATQVFYGSYSDGPGDKDGESGFRAVWLRTLTPAEGDRRLVSVITFWKFDQATSAFRPAAMRVRTQLGADTADVPRGFFGGVSFQLSFKDDGSVATIAAGDYVDETGARRPGVPYESLAHACNGCHGQTQAGQLHHVVWNPAVGGSWRFGQDDLRDLVVNEPSLKDTDSVTAFLQTLPAERRTNAALLGMLTKPRTTFLPAGILAAIDARREEVRTRDCAGQAPTQAAPAAGE